MVPCCMLHVARFNVACCMVPCCMLHGKMCLLELLPAWTFCLLEHFACLRCLPAIMRGCCMVHFARFHVACWMLPCCMLHGKMCLLELLPAWTFCLLEQFACLRCLP